MKDQRPASKLMSMTGFAARQGSFEDWSWSEEIRAVNGRSLDLRLRLPEVEGLEPELRKRLQSQLGRGNVTLQIKLQREEGGARIAVNEVGLAAALDALKAIETAAGDAGVHVAPVRASDIAGMRSVLDITESDAGDQSGLKAALIAETEACLNDFVADRAREGAALAAVIARQLEQIANLTDAARQALGDREAAQKAGMERALKRLLETTDLADEARVQQELALLAVKTDIAEELDRLSAHIAAAEELLATEGPVGRKLDFLMQEFNREANTLCSKAQSQALTAIGLDLKTVIDQMREQVQNIE